MLSNIDKSAHRICCTIIAFDPTTCYGQILISTCFYIIISYFVFLFLLFTHSSLIYEYSVFYLCCAYDNLYITCNQWFFFSTRAKFQLISAPGCPCTAAFLLHIQPYTIVYCANFHIILFYNTGLLEQWTFLKILFLFLFSVMTWQFFKLTHGEPNVLRILQFVAGSLTYHYILISETQGYLHNCIVHVVIPVYLFLGITFLQFSLWLIVFSFMLPPIGFILTLDQLKSNVDKITSVRTVFLSAYNFSSVNL